MNTKSDVSSLDMSDHDLDYVMRSYDSRIVTKKSNDGSVYKFEKDFLDYSMKTLDNGLQILFIQDEYAISSEIRMSVGAGHSDNPIGYDGLAHFLEHMLFIGSEQYPQHDLYGKLVAECHGNSNAYTADDHTVYYFTCKSNMLFDTDLVDVFCNFFVNPLLDPHYVEKEITAVDYEHEKNIGSDNMRIWSLFDKFIVDDFNGRFRTGNKETLKISGDTKQSDLIDALRNFYNEYYKIDNMILIVVHNDLTELFIRKISNIFIPNKRSEK